MATKTFNVCRALLLELNNVVYVDLLKSSTIVIKYLKWSCVGVWYGPHKSTCNNSKMEEVKKVLVLKGIL